MMINWAMSQILSYLRYMELRGEVVQLDELDGSIPWAAT